jgi:hypothetical protein
MTAERGQCFRKVSAPGQHGAIATPCPHIVEWRGRVQDADGKWLYVDACAQHVADLTFRQRIPSD